MIHRWKIVLYTSPADVGFLNMLKALPTHYVVPLNTLLQR